MTEPSSFFNSLLLKEKPQSALSFRAVEDSLFLEAGDSYSRLEVYASPLLQRQNDQQDAVGNVLAQPSTTGHHTGDSSDNFSITEMESLRNPEDIELYHCRTQRFRAFFIRQRFSYSALSISSDLFEALLAKQRISQQTKSYIMFFGERDHEIEIAPPPLKYRPIQTGSPEKNGSGHECMYGLRYFEPNGRGNPEEPTTQWSLRQTAVYCRQEPLDDGTTWLFTAISAVAQGRLDAYVTRNPVLESANPLEIHLLLLDTAIANWRIYLVDLAAEIDEEGAQIAGISPKDEGPTSLSDDNRRQHLISLDEKVLSALLVARASIDTVASLQDVYCVDEFAKDEGYELVKFAFKEQKRDLNVAILRLEALRAKLQSFTSLLSSFLDLSSGFGLQNLALESRKENEAMRILSQRMHKLTEKATQDAAAVKVLTILTLIYLPATVVSNFFSTSFVGTENHPDGSSKIFVLGDWWIFVAVAVPLTIITLYIWWVWTRIQAHRRYPWWLVCLRPHKVLIADSELDLENGVQKAS